MIENPLDSGHSTLGRDNIFNYELGQQPLDVVQDYIPIGATTTLFGQPGLGKTFAAMSLVMSVVTGRPWCGATIDTPGNAGMLAFECSHEIVQQRVRAYTSYYHICNEDLQYNPYIRSNECLFLTLPDGEGVLQDYIQRHELRLLVIDTLSKVINGDENSTKDMNELSKCLSRIAANTQSAIVIVHHEAKASAGRKKGTSRGSGALLADVRSEMRVHDTNNQKTLEHTKANNSEKRKAVKYNLVNKELGLDKHGKRIKAGVLVPEKTLEEQIQDFNSGNYQYTRKDFELHWDLEKTATRDRLKKLREDGKVTLIGRQYHTKTPLNEL